MIFLSSCATHTKTLTEIEPSIQENKRIYDHKDRDFDGVLDEKDQCPNTPKDVKVDKIGCPMDLDKDLVFDYQDSCPNTVSGSLVDSKGCALDSDKDGVINLLDSCANTPAGIATDDSGCPLDDDNDLVYNEIDQCKNTPEVVLVDNTGCSLDLDLDGIINYNDLCPNTPKDAEVDTKGCPIDSDEDGIYDYQDQCPTKGNGYIIDDKGCPQVEKIIKNINLNINFDSTSDKIKPEFIPKIKKIATFMTEHPKSTVVIEGHTDNQSKTMDNTELSYNRALAVSNYLIKMFHIDKKRITQIGYGPSKPIASNDTYSGRAKNRRVIAVITYEQDNILRSKSK